jgi:hypothetical protein
MNMRDDEFFGGRVAVANSIQSEVEDCKCEKLEVCEKEVCNACPECGCEVFPSSGCWICLSCGYSPCK